VLRVAATYWRLELAFECGGQCDRRVQDDEANAGGGQSEVRGKMSTVVRVTATIVADRRPVSARARGSVQGDANASWLLSEFPHRVAFTHKYGYTS
jgi:hypothetical protein